MTQEKIDQPEVKTGKPDRTDVHLMLSIATYISVWLAAMGHLSIFDVPVILLFFFSSAAGSVRGGIKEFFGFIAAIISLLVAIYCSSLLANSTSFNFGTGNPLLAEVIWFILLLFAVWLVFYLLIFQLTSKTSKIPWLISFDRRFGITVGFVKGAIFAYIFLILVKVTAVGKVLPVLQQQSQKSFSIHTFEIVEDKYELLATMDRSDIVQRMQRFSMKISIKSVVDNLYEGEQDLHEKMMKFLVWLNENPQAFGKLSECEEWKNFMKNFVSIPEVKDFARKNPILRQWVRKTYQNMTEVLTLLNSQEMRDLSQFPSIKTLLRGVNLGALQASVGEK